MNMTDYIPTRPQGFDYDAALADLQEKIRHKKKAKTMLAHFAEEAARLTSVMEDRKSEYEVEQEEAEAMQSATLTLLLYRAMICRSVSRGFFFCPMVAPFCPLG